MRRVPHSSAFTDAETPPPVSGAAEPVSPLNNEKDGPLPCNDRLSFFFPRWHLHGESNPDYQDENLTS